MPRPRNPITIIDPIDIMNLDDIQDEKWSLLTLIPHLCDKEQCIQWLAKRLLKNSTACGRCGESASLNHYRQHVDGYRWKCNDCNFTSSIRSQSWLANSPLSLQSLMQVTYF